MSFVEKYGPVALIAGGSEGVGASYAHMLAERGLDLVLVARKPEPLEALRAELAERFPDRTVTTLSADLTDAAAPERLADLTRDLTIGLLIYNAGASSQAINLVDNDLAYAQRLTALNATTPLALVHHYGGAMKARGRGGIILNSSAAAFVGNPGLAIYSAAKVYLSTMGEALWHELRPAGVDVLVHVLGAVDTPFIARNYPRAVGMGAAPDDIAAAGLAAIGDGPVLYAPGNDHFLAMLNGMPRGAAVEAAYAAGQMYAQATS